MKGPDQDHGAGKGQALSCHMASSPVSPHCCPWAALQEETLRARRVLGMCGWKRCSTVVLEFLETAVHVWVLLKPRERARQYGEQAGSVRQSNGGGGGREDQPAGGGEEESG